MDVKFKKQFPTRKELEIVSSTRLWKRQDKAARLIQRTYRNFRRYYCPTRLTGVRGRKGLRTLTHFRPPLPPPPTARPTYSHHTPLHLPTPLVQTRTRLIHPSSLSRPPGTRFPNRTVLSVLPTESASDFFSSLLNLLSQSARDVIYYLPVAPFDAYVSHAALYLPLFFYSIQFFSLVQARDLTIRSLRNRLIGTQSSVRRDLLHGYPRDRKPSSNVINTCRKKKTSCVTSRGYHKNQYNS